MSCLIRSTYTVRSLLFFCCLITGMATVTAQELVAHWSFDEYDEEASTYTDVTGNGFDATCSKRLALVEGISGSALNSDSINYTFQVANSIEALSPPEFTVEALVQPARIGDAFHTVFSTQSFPGSSDAGYSLEINDQRKIRFSMVSTAGTDWMLCEGTSTLEADTWYHLAITFDGSTLRSYVNGVVEKSIDRGSGYKVADKDASIGCQEDASGTPRNWFSGLIDDLKVYNYALSADTLAAHFNGYDIPEPPQPEPQLIAYWSFDSTDDQSVYYDVTGNGYNAEASAVSVGRGVLGNALDCSGETAEIVVPSSAGEFHFGSYTVEGWIYSNINLENPGSFYNFKGIFDNARVGMEASGVTGGYNLQISDKGYLHVGMSTPQGGSWNTCVGTTQLQPRTWYHVVSTYENRTIRVYMDGVLEGETELAGDYLISGMLPARIASQYQLTDYENNTGRYRHQFDGKIDELKLYNYALDEETILEHYNDLKPEEEPSFEINIGMKTTFAQPGDTVVMPVYIANHEEYTISALQLVMQYDPDQLRLLSATKDSGIVAGWELFDWNDATEGSVPLAMAGTSVALEYGEGELFRAVFVVSEDVGSNDTCTIALEEVSIDEQNNLVVSTTQSGKVIIADKSILYGDVTGNGEVNVADAQMVLKYVVGAISLPDDECCPNFTVAVADVSANGSITSYDAALIFQYSLGLIPSFPVETTTATAPPILAKRAGDDERLAQLSFKQVANDDDKQVFDLVGTRLYGFYAGEFAIMCNNGAELLSRSTITTRVKGATLSSRYVADDNLLKVAVSSNDDIDDDEPVTIVRITLPPSDGDASPEFSVKTALINEGRIPTEFENRELAGLRNNRGVHVTGALPVVRLVNRKLIIRRDGATPARITVSNLQGRTVAAFTVNGSVGVLHLDRLGNGVYLYRIQDAAGSMTGQLSLIGR